MFNINTGSDGGSKGPWLTWSSNGSAEKGFPPRSWVMRSKGDDGSKSEVAVAGFTKPCVMDLDTLKLGWEKDGAAGQAPERVWSPSISNPMARPDESKKPGSQAYAWSRALSVRIALSASEAATWEQGSFAAYEGFTRLSKLINAEWPAHSQNGKLLPVIHQTGVEKVILKTGSANVPIFAILKWVARPACLIDEAPGINTGDDDFAAPPARTAAAPAPQAKATAELDDEIPF